MLFIFPLSVFLLSAAILAGVYGNWGPMCIAGIGWLATMGDMLIRINKEAT